MSDTTRGLKIIVLLLSLSLALASLPLASASAAPGHWRSKAWFAHETEDVTEETEEPVEPASEPENENVQLDPPAVTEPDPPAPEPPPADVPPVDPAPIADIPIEVPADPASDGVADSPPAEPNGNDDTSDTPEAGDPVPAIENSEPIDAPDTEESEDVEDDASTEDEQPPAESGDFTAAASPVAVDDTATTHQGDFVDVPARANDTDADGDPLAYAGFTQPANGSVFQPVSPPGMLRYTPAPGFVGTDSFTYTISDGTDTASATITVTITNTPPVAVDDSATTHQGDAVDVPARANDTDADGDTLAYGSFTQPTNGGVFRPASPPNMLRYTPDPGFVGTDSFTYTITDGAATASATITVTVTNTPPVAVDDTATVHQGDFVDVPARANDTDADGDALAYGSFSQPTNGSVFRPASPPNMLRYTPDDGFVGTDSFTYTISDGAATASATITVTVTNTDPVAVDDTATVNPGNSVDVPALANDTDADSDGLAYMSFTQPANGEVFRPAFPPLMLRYTPDAGFAGTDSFTYVITDGATTDTGTVTITVTDVNSPPVANPDTFTMIGRDLVTINVVANDTDPDGDVLQIVPPVTQPANGVSSFAFDVVNQVTYLPNKDFVGTDTFTYVLSDGETTSIGTVTVTVLAAQTNQPPVANDDSYTIPQDTPLVVPAPGLFANDSDPDGDSISIPPLLIPNIEFGTITLDRETGAFTYTPNPGFVGTDGFTYFIDDGQAMSEIATVTITVEPAASENLPPIAVDDSYTTAQDTPLEVPAPGIFANDSDPDGDAIMAAGIIPDPAHGSLTISASTGFFVYTPDPGFVGTDSFPYQLTDGQTLSNVATVTITVEPAAPQNLPPVAVDDEASTAAGVPVTIDVLANDFDPDDGSPDDDRPELFLERLVEEPAHGTATFNPDNTITYTPAPGFAGVDQFAYTIADGSSSPDSAPATVTVTVEGTPPPPPDPDPPAEQPEEPKEESPKQPAAKPAPKPAEPATMLPDTGVGASVGRNQDHSLLMGMLLALLCALVVLRRRLV